MKSVYRCNDEFKRGRSSLQGKCLEGRLIYNIIELCLTIELRRLLRFDFRYFFGLHERKVVVS